MNGIAANTELGRVLKVSGLVINDSESVAAGIWGQAGWEGVGKEASVRDSSCYASYRNDVVGGSSEKLE